MKKIYSIILLIFLTVSVLAQANKKVSIDLENNKISSQLDSRKEKGFYSIMQMGVLFGNHRPTNQVGYYYPDYAKAHSSMIASPAVSYNTQTTLKVIPSFAFSSGYMFNEHWAIGAGLGFEVSDYNLFPLFTEVRYTLWDNKISPFAVIKSGYSLGNLKAKHYDDLSMNWAPYHLNDAKLRNYGGLMFHPEIGIKIPLSKNSDLLFTVAYRYQKTKSVAKKEYDNSKFDEWEHSEDVNMLSFGVAIMFR